MGGEPATLDPRLAVGRKVRARMGDNAVVQLNALVHVKPHGVDSEKGLGHVAEHRKQKRTGETQRIKVDPRSRLALEGGSRPCLPCRDMRVVAPARWKTEHAHWLGRNNAGERAGELSHQT